MRLRHLALTGGLLLAVGCSTATDPTSTDWMFQEQPAEAALGTAGRGHGLPSAATQPAPAAPTAPVDAARIAGPAPLARGAVKAARLGLQAVPAGADVRVRLKLLLITATEDESGFAAMRAFLGQMGVPHDTLVASKAELTPAMLESEPGLGNYQGVILTTGNLTHFDGTGWYSALSEAEWRLLHDYERAYGARQLTLYTHPDGVPRDGAGVALDDYGLRFTGSADTTNAALATTLTTEGAKVFADLNPKATVPIRYAWTYLATAANGGVPLLTTSSGGVVAAVRSANGRENLAVTAPHNPYLVHSQTLAYGLVRWVTRGVFLGERQVYFSAQADDYFIANEIWSPALGRNGYEFRVRSSDLAYLDLWQRVFQRSYPLFSTFKTDMAYNGRGFVVGTPNVCAGGRLQANTDLLTAASLCLKSSFRWTNHTFTHIYIDDATDAATMREEIGKNNEVAAGMRLSSSEFDKRALVTGNHSGLGYLDEATPPANRGLSKSNPGLVSAAQETGVRHLASNSSAPTTAPICVSTPSDCNQNNPSPNAGLRFPGNLPANQILLVPRYPTNIFYNVTTAAELVSEYNTIYRSYWGKDLTYAEILDFETDLALAHMVSGSVNPHFFHQSNLRAVNGRSLLADYVEGLAKKYSARFKVPVRNLSMSDTGARLERRMRYDAAGAAGLWNKTTGRVSLTATDAAAPIPFTNPASGEVYGPDRIATLASGAAVAVGAGR